MERKHASLLTVIATVITALVATYINVGLGPFIVLALVSVVALPCWLRFSFQDQLSQDKIVAPYILAIVLNLVLNTSRYWSNYAQFINENRHSLFAPHFVITDVSWFIVFVTCPVSLMLLGGYYLSKRTPIGFYLAWWTFLYSIAEAIIQFKVEFLSAIAYNHQYFVGALAASAQMIIGVIGCQRLLQQHPSSGQHLGAVSGLTFKQMNLWTALLVSLVAVYAAALYQQAGLLVLHSRGRGIAYFIQ